MKPVLSVIIPMWNEENYLRSCLQSLKNQKTSFQYEVILVDNNSSDNSLKIASKFPVSIVSEKRQGRSYSRNKGIELARGEFIVLTEADCILPSDWLQTIYSHFASHPEIIGLAGTSFFYNSSDYQKYLLKLLIISSSLMYRFFSGNNTLRGQNSAFQKSILKKTGSFNPDYTPFDDLEFGFRAGKFGLIDYLPDLIVKTSDRRIKKRLFKSFFLHLSGHCR